MKMSFWKKIWEFIVKIIQENKPEDNNGGNNGNNGGNNDNNGGNEPVNSLSDAIDPKTITWLGVDVGKWEKKYTLKVTTNASQIVYDQEGTSKWTPKNEAGVMATGNPWVIAKLNGKWTAATHEWMRVGQKVKGKRSVHGDHIKRREFGDTWTPTLGEEYGFCVSGLCRGSQRNQSERTQIIMFKWK